VKLFEFLPHNNR